MIKTQLFSVFFSFEILSKLLETKEKFLVSFLLKTKLGLSEWRNEVSLHALQDGLPAIKTKHFLS